MLKSMAWVKARAGGAHVLGLPAPPHRGNMGKPDIKPPLGAFHYRQGGIYMLKALKKIFQINDYDTEAVPEDVRYSWWDLSNVCI